ncbi:MAG: Unknown protein [uncultured Sulfurovum sp.]|uniref:Uncharacterized protein n=1 Tax=uncultured Sulfurovum sp. TaxID=269237 RepID=A0A6S6TWF1_9BACT|nr:MAG: Unknown protein [uncultured Sulfurovum sp.]
MKTDTIKTSLKLIQVEQMVIILKELKHIKNILDFFHGYKEIDKQNHESKPIKKNIYYLRRDIVALEEKIQMLETIHQEMSHDTTVLFLIKYDYIRTQIEDLLGVVEALYNKMQQFFGETLNQYLPYPILGRRFSNNATMMYLNNYYREMLKNFSTRSNHEEKDQLILGWNFKTGFKYRIFVNREIKRKGYKKDVFNNYIDLPYWYYELPMLLPSITHEVASIALRHPKEALSIPYQSLNDKLHDFLSDTNNNFIQKVQDIIGYTQYANELAKEIMADLIAYHVHQEAYMNALFHNTIAEKLSKDYLKVIHKEGNEYLKMLPNEWYFNQKKDHAILRLHFLLYLIQDKEAKKGKQSETYEEMYNMLNALMPLDNTKIEREEGFSKTYKYHYPNFHSSYQSVQNYLMQTLNVLKQWYHSNKYHILNFPSPQQETSCDFSTLWKQRYEIQSNNENMVLHQNNFRLEIHDKISQIPFLSTIKQTKEPVIYVLELGKARKDTHTNLNNPSDIMHLVQDEINAENKLEEVQQDSSKAFSVYGIYDWASIKEKKNIIDINKKIKSLLPNTKHNNTKKLKYFKTKQVLLKVHAEIQGETTTKEKQTFSAIYNMELEKTINKNKCTNGYKSLDESINYIVNKLNKADNKSKFKRANIYKSLGPKDLTVILEESSLAFIFDFISQLNKVPYKEEQVNILRTFTMICSSFEQTNLDLTSKQHTFQFQDPFILVSYLRISNTFTKKELQELLHSNRHDIKVLYEITGVMDYRLEWKEGIAMQTVLTFYNKMIDNECLTDFQTKIEKRENILEER